MNPRAIHIARLVPGHHGVRSTHGLASRRASVEDVPVPRVQVFPLPDFEASFQFDGRELTRFHFDPERKRPFWYPVQTSLAPSV